MMKRIVIMANLFVVALVLFTPLTSQAAFPIQGITTGVIMSEDSKPFMATGFVSDFSVESIGGKIFDLIEISALQSDRSWDKASELYVNRNMVMRTFRFGNHLFAAMGVGGWLMINTNGPDIARLAGRVSLGAQFMGVHTFVNGEYVHQQRADWYFVNISLIITEL